MVKHIVLFKFKPFETAVQKAAKMEQIKTALYSLRDKLPFLKSIEVGINENPSEQFDLALTTTFESMADLEKYAVHPDHLAVARLIGEVKLDRACVDYQF